MATVKRLLSDIDNKVAAEKKKPEPFESVITKWASDGFDEKTHPYASGSGKGVFHQAKFLHTFDPEEKFDVPVKADFDFGSASKKKAIADLNKRLSGHGIMASVSYPDDDSGNDQIIFSKIPQENKTQKINPKKVYEGAASSRRKELLGQMEGIRNKEKENERNLLKDFGNNAIPYDEFKNKQNQLHQEAQGRVDSLYDQLVGGGKTNPDDDFRLDESDERAAHIVMGIEDDLGIEILDAETYNAVMNELVDRGYTRKQAADMIEVNIDDALMDRIRSEINDDMMRDDYPEKTRVNEPAKINPRQVYENASNAKPRTNSEIIDQSSRDISAELDAELKNGQISKEEWQEKKANLEAFDRSRKVRAELEKRNGRKYSDDEWANIVELASQLR